MRLNTLCITIIYWHISQMGCYNVQCLRLPQRLCLAVRYFSFPCPHPPHMSLLKLKQWKTCWDNHWITSAVVSGRKESVVPKDYFWLCQCQPRLFTQLLDQLQWNNNNAVCCGTQQTSTSCWLDIAVVLRFQRVFSSLEGLPCSTWNVSIVFGWVIVLYFVWCAFCRLSLSKQYFIAS